MPALGFVLAAVAAAVLLSLTGFYPLQSEDWIHLEIIAQRPWQDAFDLHVSHARPLWFLGLWSMLPTGLEHPALMRIPLFVMHGVIGGLVGVLAQSLGASSRRALLTVVLFLCFPTVKGLSWILAISTPQHVLLMLVAMIAAVAHVKRPRAATGILLIAAQVLAVVAHSAAALLPGCIAMLAIAVSSLRWRVLLDRWLLLHLAVGAALILVLASLPTTERYHSIRSLPAIMANGSRALLSLLPELVRGPAIEGLRGAYGSAGMAFGLTVCALTATFFCWVLWRASAVCRALFVAALIDLVPPILTAGFVVRYAYFPAAMASIALLLAARPTKRWLVAIGALGCLWLVDTAVDVTEIRRGGELGTVVIEAARAVRAEVGPGVAIVLVNAPGEVGAERDVPVFNWGLAEALAKNGVDGPWQFARTENYITSSDVDFVEVDRLAEMVREGVAVWGWDACRQRFVRR